MKNLITANKIINEIAKANKNITPVTLSDLPLFQSFFDREPHTYGNSWTYVTQGVYGIGPNNLGYKYYDGKNLSMVCVYPKIEQPDVNVFYWIRPMGTDILEIISDISGQIKNIFSVPSYVKKLFKNQYDILLQNGFTGIEKFPWHTLSWEEDDTFPEQIVDVNKTVGLSKTLSRKKHLRKSYVRTLQLNSEYDIKISTKNFEKITWDLTRDFFESKIIKDKKSFLSNENDYYNMIFANNNNSKVLRGYVSVNNRPLGYYVMEEQSSSYTSLYALIVLRDKLKFLVDLLLLEILKSIKTPYLNMGGSEDDGIHEFKKKFYPVNELDMFWVTNH